MKKLQINILPKVTYEQMLFNENELTDKVNEVVDWINSQPKKLEVKHEKKYSNFVCFIDDIDEWMVIQKCLKYCKHRLDEHKGRSGLEKALSGEDRKVFYKLIEKI